MSSVSTGLRSGSGTSSGALGNADGSDDVAFGTAAGEGDGDRDPFLRLRRRADRSESGVEGFHDIGFGLLGLAGDLVFKKEGSTLWGLAER